MAEMQESVGEVDVRASSDARTHDAPLAVLLAGVKRRRATGATADFRALVESQVVPRLHAAHRADVSGCDGFAGDGFARNASEKDLNAFEKGLRQLPSQTILPVDSALADEVSALGDRLFVNDHAGACDRIDALRIEGRSLECIYLDLLAPTASYIRHLWSDDLCDLAGAAVALVNLQGVLRHFAPAFRAEHAVLDTGRRALLASPLRTGVDGAAAMVGLVMVSEFFRRDGWDSWIEPDVASTAFGDTVRREWFDVVEILASNDRQLDGIAASIRTIRRGSANRSVGVIVCGQIFIDHPEFVRLVGADLPSSDPRTTLVQASHFMARNLVAKNFVSLPIPSARSR